MIVRKGQVFEFHPTGWDIFDRGPNTPTSGMLVRVCRPHGCPPPGTMGHCHVETMTGNFIGLVSLASLRKPSLRVIT